MRLLLTILGVFIGLGVMFILFSLLFGDVENAQVMTSAVVSAFSPEEQQDFEIADDCGIMFGRILHNVKNEETCAQKCRVKCGSEDLSFVSSEFELGISACNKCVCHCKG